MTRVATFHSRQILTARMMELQTRVHDSSLQVNTEKKSQTYDGIATDSFRLISMETLASRTTRYKELNQAAEIRVQTMNQSIESAEQALRDFRGRLIDFAQFIEDPPDTGWEAQLDEMREYAFLAMGSIEYFLNQDVDGRYLFSGGRTDVAPINLGAGTVEDFAALYDGNTVTFGERRAATLFDVDFRRVDLTTADVGPVALDLQAPFADTLTYGFADGLGTIDGARPGTFDDLSPGDTLTIAGGAINNGAYTVESVLGDGTGLRVSPPFATVGATDTPANLNVSPTFGEIRAPAGASTFVTGTLDTVTAVDWTTTVADPDPTVREGSITAGFAGAFSGLEQGMTLLIDSGGANDGVYTVTEVSRDGQTIKIEPPPAADLAGDPVTIRIGVPDGATTKMENSSANGDYRVRWPSNEWLAASGTMADALAGEVLYTEDGFGGAVVHTDANLVSRGYYQGDQLTQRHRVDDTREIALGVNAQDAAVEKALRGLGILAQGKPLTDSGDLDIDEVRRRVDRALVLTADALEHSSEVRESAGSFSSMNRRVGLAQVALDDAQTRQRDFVSFLETRITAVENVDMAEAVTKLNDDMRALEASYNVTSRLAKLTLNNYL